MTTITIRIDETERFETLEGKIISYSIPNEHYKNIGDGHTDSYMTYRNEDYDKLYPEDEEFGDKQAEYYNQRINEIENGNFEGTRKVNLN